MQIYPESSLHLDEKNEEKNRYILHCACVKIEDDDLSVHDDENLAYQDYECFKSITILLK